MGDDFHKNTMKCLQFGTKYVSLFPQAAAKLNMYEDLSSLV